MQRDGAPCARRAPAIGVGLTPLAVAVLLYTPGAYANGPDRDGILQQVNRPDLTPDQAYEWIDLAERIKQDAKSHLPWLERLKRSLLDPWVFFGFLAQAAFMMRFVVQLIASERKGRSYIPVAFWYFSLAGGLMLLTYAIFSLRDPVFTMGQALGCFIYLRNLVLIRRRSARYESLSNGTDGNEANSP